jgi:hypothetical protein
MGYISASTYTELPAIVSIPEHCLQIRISTCGQIAKLRKLLLITGDILPNGIKEYHTKI